MEYSDSFMRHHEEMCRVTGSIVFALAEASHDSRRENIVAVLRSEMAQTGKYDWRSGPREDIIRCIDSCIKTVARLPAESVEKLRGKHNLTPSGLKGNNSPLLAGEYL